MVRLVCGCDDDGVSQTSLPIVSTFENACATVTLFGSKPRLDEGVEMFLNRREIAKKGRRHEASRRFIHHFCDATICNPR